MKRFIVVALFLAVATAAGAQEATGTDPVFWCDISRSQVSHERDAALAQIEKLKITNTRLEESARLLRKALEEAVKKSQATEVKPDTNGSAASSSSSSNPGSAQ